ncbi:hypothetical protein KP509_06G068700 [Ceratopteris richardii]|uniref:Peptidase A1 domain-containing protein n=1 Tax=Ceratopteris richardii TaxID=49495 RepID=A0A8T2UPR6_CERRI|nr:hypothetical protein KP509_06G068700 [Ceratopteris richardii]
MQGRPGRPHHRRLPSSSQTGFRMTIVIRQLRSSSPLFSFLLFICCVSLSAFVAFTTELDDQQSLFRLQQHTFNGSFFNHGGKPVSFEHLSHIRLRDRIRYNRMLANVPASLSSPISFNLGGIADPNIAGLYFTEIYLGTPPSKYYVQVDTGSDLLWVNCADCKTCPTSTDLEVQLSLYNPKSSSTSSTIMCGDSVCNDASTDCLTDETCGYQLGYGDGSFSEGFFVRDTLHLNLIPGDLQLSRSTEVAFGCGTRQGGQLSKSDQALDGILGLGQSGLSVISQLRDKNKTNGMFAHCLESKGKGGGILAVGKVKVPGLVYTPIIPNQPHYNVNLMHIFVNNMSILVDSSVSQDGGTIFDSGTTLTYFSDEIFEALLGAVLGTMQMEAKMFEWQGMKCVSYSGRFDDVFPSFTLMFYGGSAMSIRPHEYLIQAEGKQGHGWCFGFQTTGSSGLNINILGGWNYLVLKDKLVVYDLEQQRIGWVDHNCSSNITLSSENGENEVFSATSIPKQGIPNGRFESSHLRTIGGAFWLCLMTLFIYSI